MSLSPYTFVKMDCYQNLLMTLLNHYGCDVFCLGAQWPWEYCIKDDIINYPVIKIKNFITADSIRDIFNINIKSIKVSNDEDSLFSNLTSLITSRPVIVNVDQYYIPHHYTHIYLKQHGEHFLLIYDYDSYLNAFMCIDTFPEYKGSIGKSDLLDAISHFDNKELKTFRYLTGLDAIKQMDTKALISRFVSDMLNDQKFIDGYKVIDLKEILNAIIFLRDEMDEKSYINWLTELCKGNWIWEIDRNGIFFVSFMKSLNDYFVNNELLKYLIDESFQLNNKINIIMKKIYKLTLSKTIYSRVDIYKELKEIVKKEENIKNKLLALYNEVIR